MSASSAAAFFRQRHGREPSCVWGAPGRVNLIGEHTDYNDGFVLPFAIDRTCLAAMAPARGRLSSVTSAQRPDDPITFDAARVEPGDVDGWAAYVTGVVWALRTAGHDIPPFDVVVDSSVPLGASLSSSAALECSIGATLNDMLGLGLSPTDVALMAQRAENDFVGMPCGAMDQMASMHGRAGHVVFLDTRTMDVEAVPLDPPSHALELLVIDTRAPHALVDGEYAARRRDCEAAARLLGVPALRDITLDDLPLALRRLRDDVLVRRVRHVVSENARVLALVAQMRLGADPRDIADLLTQSHASMRDDFEITVPHVDVAVDTALRAGAHGARMTGGGFGGSVIALVDTALAPQVVASVERAYSELGYAPPAAFIGDPAEGARRLA